MIKRYFKDRADAGNQLAQLLKYLKDQKAVIYALPRGGIVVAAPIAKTLNSPLDLIITRKIGHPNQPENAIGAVAENGHSVLNKDEILEIDEAYLKEEVRVQREEARRRREVYLGGREPIPCKDGVAILVDDGMATGLTMKAAIKELKLHYHPKKIIVAVPIIPEEMANELETEGTAVTTVIRSKDFSGSIGSYYQDFTPIEDQVVIEIMQDNPGAP